MLYSKIFSRICLRVKSLSVVDFPGKKTTLIEARTTNASIGLILTFHFVGIFFANPQNSTGVAVATLKPYASVQGFIKYDRVEKKALGGAKAIDPFNQYADIQNDLYAPIIQQLNRNYIELRDINRDK